MAQIFNLLFIFKKVNIFNIHLKIYLNVVDVLYEAALDSPASYMVREITQKNQRYN